MPENSTPKLGAVLNEAQAILAAAEARAKDILEKAEQAHEEARKEGYRIGYSEGKADAVTNAVRMLEESSMISDRLSSEAAHLALAISSFVIGRQVEIAPETVKDIALRALQQSVIGESTRITVHPEDKEVIERGLDEFRHVAGGAAILVDVDASMTRGGCTVRTDFGEVDASIEALIDAVSLRLGMRI